MTLKSSTCRSQKKKEEKREKYFKDKRVEKNYEVYRGKYGIKV